MVKKAKISKCNKGKPKNTINKNKSLLLQDALNNFQNSSKSDNSISEFDVKRSVDEYENKEMMRPRKKR